MKTFAISGKKRFPHPLAKPMGIILIVGGTLLLILAGPLQPYLAATLAADGFYVPDDYYRFSDAEVNPQSETVAHTFTLYNGSLRSLQLQAIADCGCTSTSWQNTVIPPLSAKSLKVEIPAKPRSSTTVVLRSTQLQKSFFLSCEINQKKNTS